MADEKVTCRYCPNQEVSYEPTAAGLVPVCELHRDQLAARTAAELDRIMGQPVVNPKFKTDEPVAPPKES